MDTVDTANLMMLAMAHQHQEGAEEKVCDHLIFFAASFSWVK